MEPLGSVWRSACRESRRCRNRILERARLVERFVLKELRRIRNQTPLHIRLLRFMAVLQWLSGNDDNTALAQISRVVFSYS
jgi:hypothetical protein